MGFGSQRSSFIPWDHGGAGISSDLDMGGFAPGDVADLELGGSGEDFGYVSLNLGNGYPSLICS